MNRWIYVVAFSTILFSLSLAQINVSGSAYLSSQSDHSGIKVLFYNLVSSLPEDSVYTVEAGYHSVVWNADSHASGVYFVKMVAGEFVNTQKLMLVK